jgi:hypothetical protein
VSSQETFEADVPSSESPTQSSEVAPTPVPSNPIEEPVEKTNSFDKTTSPGLLAEDSATELAPDQMKKSEFLVLLRSEVCRSVEAVLAEAGQTSDDCPYLNYWFDFYSRKESTHIESAIHRYAPEATSATTARDYISIIAQRARQAAEEWARTGEITGVPEGVPTTLPGEASEGEGGGATADTSAVMFKARKGGAVTTDDPRAIQTELGNGSPLDSSVRSRMESAFGMNFSHVRTHTDNTAAAFTDRFNARAFTIGKHITFGAGEYQPGSPLGDALIAHELAHVIQQESVGEPVATQHWGNAGSEALEKDADRTATEVLSILWDNASSTFGNTIPRLRTGLTLQRCPRTTSGTSSTPTLTFSTVSGPTPADCGGFSWGVRWAVRNATSSTNGWIVQKVEYNRDVKDCSSPPNDVPYSAGSGLNPAWYPLWEAWQVRGGNVFIGRSASPHSADTYGAPPIGDSTKGNLEVKGTADYYDGLTLPSSFTVTNAAPTWALPATNTQPTLSGGAGVLDHSLEATWDCCTSTKTTTLTTSSPP